MACKEKETLGGRFIARGNGSIPTTPPTPPRTRKDTPPSQTHAPSHRTPEIPEAEIQSKESPTTKLALRIKFLNL